MAKKPQSASLREITRRDWRTLGYYYVRNDETREWRLVGSRDGLSQFAMSLRTLATGRHAHDLGAHDHLGPYWYLEIGIHTRREFTDHWIAGTALDLLALATIVEAGLTLGDLGKQVHLRDDYAPEAAYDLVLDIREDDFDPASADPELVILPT